MAVNIYSADEVRKVCDSGAIAYNTHMYLKDHLEPGISTHDLDELAHAYITKQGAIPAFLGFQGYPATICSSLNDAVVHGIPSKQSILVEGDIVGIDLGVNYEGYFSDTAWTWPIGKVSDMAKKLINVTQRSLYRAIEYADTRYKIGAIGECVESYIRKHNFSVVRALTGHGIGKNIHEEPAVPNYGSRKTGPNIKSGIIIAIEPMVNAGGSEVFTDDDGWTIRTNDGSLSAHFEHTVAVTDKGPMICTLPVNSEIDVFSLINKIENVQSR